MKGGDKAIPIILYYIISIRFYIAVDIKYLH